MHAVPSLLRVLIAVFILTPPLAACAAADDDPARVGFVNKVENTAEVVSASGTTTAMVGTPVHMKDELRTGDDARLQITFRDNTVLTLGEKASVVIDSYVYDPDQGVGETVLQATKGAFRRRAEAGQGRSFDFTTPAAIGARIDRVPGPAPVGYDHNYVLRRRKAAGAEAGAMTLAARVIEPKSGRTMDVRTVEPGLQFYSGNFLDGTIKNRKGVPYQKHDAFCLETQHFPDSVNRLHFPSTVLEPGKTYRTTTVYAFSAK